MSDARSTDQDLDLLRAEVSAWRNKFPKFGYSPARDQILKEEWRCPLFTQGERGEGPAWED